MPFQANGPRNLIVYQDGPEHWRLYYNLVYDGEIETFEIPMDYRTDFATVPRILQWFAPSTGAYSRAAVLHDYLCDMVAEGELPSHDADGLFRRVMREEGVPPALRWFMWTGVRWGSVFSAKRRESTLRDMPAVLGLSLLALPIVAPALVFILLGLGIYYFYEFVAGGV